MVQINVYVFFVTFENNQEGNKHFSQFHILETQQKAKSIYCDNFAKKWFYQR
jgi:hypothetical protein